MKKNRGLLSKELFIETMESIQLQYEKDLESSKLLTKVFHGDVEPYDNSLLHNQLIKIINYNFSIKPDDKFDDIDYFIWELDFGKKYKEGCYTIHGVNVKLETPEDLWNLLNEKS